MKRFVKCILPVTMLVVSFTLTACQSFNQTQMAYRYKAGKQNFAEHNYQQAFNQLMPVAKSGNADAQYAVGYMYFYGKGIVEDRNAAEYWMAKSADQGQVLAQRALGMIQQAKRANQALQKQHPLQPQQAHG